MVAVGLRENQETSVPLFPSPCSPLFHIINIARLLSSEPWSFNSCQVYSVEGADAVI